MDNQKEILFVKKHISNDNIQWNITLYRQPINYYVPPFFSKKYGVLHGFTLIETYGLMIRQTVYGSELEFYEWDLGPLSCQQYEVNYLSNLLCRSPILDRNLIYRTVKEETLTWCNNHWKSPFGKVAEKTLLRKTQIELEGPPPLPVKNSEKYVSRATRLTTAYGALRGLKIPDKLNPKNKGHSSNN
ncbi:hypothetical protein GCM10008014_51370 [Paenibacillus silvae]|uniref:Uncharacterized protein n=1 Tax=Paenibacillus silvae TaxID=1325358 RepID=A0ABQ1ZLW1_9BACL|nr:hypothetical protein [Paenibacillus silvae]GGH68689.1 hypothetical protein GCM10008014_51370 [Paenibacillus silvae]